MDHNVDLERNSESTIMPLNLPPPLIVNPDDKRTTWKSCCFTVDKHAVAFFSQLFVCCGVMLFCMYQLLHQEDCQGQQMYSGLLTLILGVLIPTPKVKK
jgi:hypothetical protein